MAVKISGKLVGISLEERNTGARDHMEQTEGKRKEVIKVTPGLIKNEIRENYSEIESYLRRHGIYITKDRKIPRWQVKKAFELLISKLRLKMTDLTEFSGYLD